MKSSDFTEKALLALGLLVFFGAGYFGLGLLSDPVRAHSLETPFDQALPFIAGFVWVYLWVLPVAPAPLFLVRSQRLYRRAALAYAMTIAIALAIFHFYPVSVASLRAGHAPDTAMSSGRLVALLYQLDPVANAFPSLHLALVTLAAITAWKASRMMGIVLAASIPLVAISVCLVKQHFAADAIAGIALALIVGTPIIVAYKSEPGETIGYSWRGPALFLAFAALGYVLLYGVAQWSPL